MFSDEKKAELSADISKLFKQSMRIAEKISNLRKENAKIIEAAINSQLADLNMSGAHFSIDFKTTDLYQKGMDSVEFMISTNPGEPEKALTKIISGGELSRIMLVMKNVLTSGDAADTLIFDEIDTGISGTTAGMVGVKLSEISKRKQVLCVTHLPQIAALADNHFKISKESSDGETNTHIEALSGNEKLRQIAFMISGDADSEASLAQAEEMIDRKI